jgi:hypothetical protein
MAKKKFDPPLENGDPDLSHIAEQLRPLAVRCDSLILDPANARKHPDDNLEAIKGSLRSFGQVKPIVVREGSRVVCCGNGTLAAARALGMTHVAANIIPLSDTAAAALAIADNRTSELAEWDEETLKSLLATIAVDDQGLQAMFDALEAEYKTEVPVEPDAPEDFKQVDENIETEHVCPRCGFSWSGGAGEK